MARQKGTPAKPPASGTAPSAPEPEPRAAYFLSLTVENVRCFGPKQTLDLSDGNGKPAPWTIILGVNGTGKTTLLQSLAGFEILSGSPTWAGEFTRSFLSVAKSHAPQSRFLHWLLESHAGESTLHSFLRSQEKAAAWEIQYTGSEINTSKNNLTSKILVNSGDEGIVQSHSGLTPRCYAYGAGRRVGSTVFRESEPDDPTATLFSDRAELRSAGEWLLQLDYAAAKAPKDKDAQYRLAQAKELLLNILPDIEDIRFTTVSGLQPRPRVEFKTPYGWVPLRQLGYGYQTLITWVAGLANRMAERSPDSANPLHEPAVVLVDEIDLHLHPRWQRKLMGFLRERFPNTQSIATAHSPLVAQAAADANLAVLRREGDHVVIDNEVDNIRNWRIDQILTSDLFGLETARPPHLEALMSERQKLLEKSKLNATEKRRLGELNELVESLPFGETAQERNERDAIRQALDALTKERKPAS